MQVNPTNIRFIVVLSLIPWFIAAYFKARPWLHILQLEGYKGKDYLTWLKQQPKKIFTPRASLELGLVVLAGLIFTHLPRLIGYPQHLLPFFGGLLATWVILQVIQIIKRPKTQAKKELIFTARALRLVAGFKIVIALEALIFMWLIFPKPGLSLGWLYAEIVFSASLFVLLQLIHVLAPWNIWLANELVAPVEKHIKQGFFKEAQEIVKQHPGLTIIGITGSYGKTSTKFILNSIMATTSHPTLMTPESYNTPMGICKVIRGELKVFHKFFIVEMGARNKGDIAELCRLTPPQMGILTAIGPQHLESFGNQETITATKGELLESLPEDGIAVINQDNQYCRELAQKLSIKCLRYGLGAGDKKDVWAQDISSGPQGTGFVLHTIAGEQVKLRTQLLGEHNVYNILAAGCAAIHWGVPLNNIARAVARLQPVPHRLQLVSAEGGINIIDDAFNSNPAGACAALQVLKTFSSGRKFLITPGMVELGAQEFEENKKFGQLAAEACDFVILVGPKRTAPIAEGLKEAGFSEENILLVKDLTSARQIMGKLVKSGDVVLFENDLPDNYSE